MAAPAPAAFRTLVETRLALLHLTKYRLAIQADVHPNTVSRWWRDLTPTAPTIRKIAPVLHTPFEELMRAAGHLDADEAPDAGADELELRQRAEEFKAGLRGIPRVFWGPVTAALTAAGSRLAEAVEALPSSVSGAGSESLTSPIEAPSGAVSADSDGKLNWQHGDHDPLPVLVGAIVTPQFLDSLGARVHRGAVLAGSNSIAAKL